MPEQSAAINTQIIPPGVKSWGGPPVLTAHGCALLERFTGKSFTYRAVNLTTGASAHICRRKNPVTAKDFDALAEKIRLSGAVPGPDYSVDARRGESVPREKLAEILEHIFTALLPEQGYAFRAEQAALAGDVLEALSRRAVSLSEAGVGIGKTHAYLIAAALAKRGRAADFWLRGNYPTLSCISEMPVVVATSSIALQKAIVKDYIPKISRVLQKRGIIMRPLSCVIRKGKEHYLCEKRLNQFRRQTSRPELERLLDPLMDRKHDADLDEMDFLDPYVKRRINVAGRCGKTCAWGEHCRYMRFMKNAQSDSHDFQICNHNYLLADVMRRAKGQHPLIPHYQAIIIDEAHKFIQAARSMYGSELSSMTLPRIAKTIRSFVFQPGQSTADLWRDADKLLGQAKRLFRVLVENVPDIYLDDEAERFKTKIDDKARRHLRNIREILGRLAAGLEERQVLSKYRGLYNHALWELENAREQAAAFENHGDLIYWLEKPEGLYSLNRDGSDETLLCAIPKRLGETLHIDLWGKGVPIILTSGTLSASGDFTHVKLGMGLDKLPPSTVMETSRPSPFNYRENALIYVSESVPFPDNRSSQYIAAVADEMERLIMAAHGHTAALFTSYRVMELIFEELKTRGLPFPLFKLGKGGTGALERFRQSGNGVLFAAGSMWEGIDLPGDILSLLVIVKLPFAVPDPISEHERTMYGSPEKYKNAVVVPEMLVKLMQGFGRLIRSEADTGVVALLDSRVREGGAYRDRVLKALPDCRVTSNIGAVRSFFLTKKPKSYFDVFLGG